MNLTDDDTTKHNCRRRHFRLFSKFEKCRSIVAGAALDCRPILVPAGHPVPAKVGDSRGQTVLEIFRGSFCLERTNEHDRGLLHKAFRLKVLIGLWQNIKRGSEGMVARNPSHTSNNRLFAYVNLEDAFRWRSMLILGKPFRSKLRPLDLKWTTLCLSFISDDCVEFCEQRV